MSRSDTVERPGAVATAWNPRKRLLLTAVALQVLLGTVNIFRGNNGPSKYLLNYFQLGGTTDKPGNKPTVFQHI